MRDTVMKHMSPGPHTTAVDSSLADALRLMSANEFRHLIVMDRGVPVGIVSDRDVYRMIARKPYVDPEVLAVAEAMTPEPVTVVADTPIADVARQMAARKAGAAVVMDLDGDRPIGIFTTMDALIALASVT
jgi:acetoin utilization protein AcuB